MGRPRGPRVEVICPGCKNPHEMRPLDVERGRKYCSVTCYRQDQHVNGMQHDGTWTCTRCKETRPIDQFPRRKSGRPQSECRRCSTERSTAWAAKNRDRTRGYQLKSVYRLTPEDVDALLAKQDWKCAGCRSDLAIGKHCHVDHCHDTKRVRGMLCQRCNMALGLLHDNADTLARLAVYVSQS